MPVRFNSLTANVPRAGDRNPVSRLRQGYGAYTLLAAFYAESLLDLLQNLCVICAFSMTVLPPLE